MKKRFYKNHHHHCHHHHHHHHHQIQERISLIIRLCRQSLFRYPLEGIHWLRRSNEYQFYRLANTNVLICRSPREKACVCQPCNSIDTNDTWKNWHFIKSESTDFYVIVNQFITAYNFHLCMLTSISVEEILATSYAKNKSW